MQVQIPSSFVSVECVFSFGGGKIQWPLEPLCHQASPKVPIQQAALGTTFQLWDKLAPHSPPPAQLTQICLPHLSHYLIHQRQEPQSTVSISYRAPDKGINKFTAIDSSSVPCQCRMQTMESGLRHLFADKGTARNRWLLCCN